MNKLKKFFFVALVFLLPVVSVHAKLNIVATTLDVADIARRIGGELVGVESLTKGTEDIHGVPMKPSFLPKLAKAQGVVHIGLSAEHAFLPALLEASANSKIQFGHVGDIDCSRYVTPLGVPLTLSRDQGEQHPTGNPHYNIDPRNGFQISKAIAEGFSRLDPRNSSIYQKNRESFDHELKEKLKLWDSLLVKTKGVKVVSYHQDMVYLADYLGLTIVAEIEPKPGIAPSPKHLESLVGRCQNENVKLILFEIQYSDNAANWLSEQTKIPIARVATMGGAFSDTASYFGMIEHNINAVVGGLK